MENNQQAARQARRFLQETVKTDWVWPLESTADDELDAELEGITEYRGRFYGTPSESESETGLEEIALGKKKQKKRSSNEAYRFDSPESVGIIVATRNEDKMRKRRKALEEEMSWNEGLSTFEKRRDCWTGATAAARKHAAITSPSSQECMPSEERRPSLTLETIPANDAVPKSPQDSANDVAEHYFSSSHTTSAQLQAQDALIPIAKPLLPSNPIRMSIGPKLYMDIFTKVVLNGRTPSVPINLSDMTRALVRGWQEAGEWPPKPGPVDPLVGRRRRSSLGMVLKDFGSRNNDEPFLKNHPHVRKGVESVKKVFRMSGSQVSGSSNYSAAKEQ